MTALYIVWITIIYSLNDILPLIIDNYGYARDNYIVVAEWDLLPHVSVYEIYNCIREFKGLSMSIYSSGMNIYGSGCVKYDIFLIISL